MLSSGRAPRSPRCHRLQARPTPAGHGRRHDQVDYGGLPQLGMRGLDAGAEDRREGAALRQRSPLRCRGLRLLPS